MIAQAFEEKVIADKGCQPLSKRKKQYGQLKAMQLYNKIPTDHLSAFVRMARHVDSAIGLSLHETMDADLLEAGYPSVPEFDMGCFADWGPMSGFICANQILSRFISRKQHDLVQEMQTRIRQAVHQGKAVLRPLRISRARLLKLQQAESDQLMHIIDKQLVIEKPIDDSMHSFIFSLRPVGLSEVEIGFMGKPLLILCDPKSEKPFIAGYQLKMMAYGKKQLGLNAKIKTKKRQVERLSHRRLDIWSALYSPGYYSLLDQPVNAKKKTPDAISESLKLRLGMITPSETGMVKALNHSLKCTDDSQLVFSNPLKSGNESFTPRVIPMLVVFPYELRVLGENTAGSRFQIACNNEIYQKLLVDLKENHYSPEDF